MRDTFGVKVQFGTNIRFVYMDASITLIEQVLAWAIGRLFDFNDFAV